MPVLKLKNASYPNRYGWTPARRRAQSARARAAQLWRKSTGPKTADGKARSAQNARRRDPVLNMVAHGLRLQRRYMQMLRFNASAWRLTKVSGQQPVLLPNGLILKTGLLATLTLMEALWQSGLKPQDYLPISIIPR